eukprot:scaffold12070_cov59-Phaeocystis_antarctica.AAC.2
MWQQRERVGACVKERTVSSGGGGGACGGVAAQGGGAAVRERACGSAAQRRRRHGGARLRCMAGMPWRAVGRLFGDMVVLR